MLADRVRAMSKQRDFMDIGLPLGGMAQLNYLKGNILQSLCGDIGIWGDFQSISGRFIGLAYQQK
jgi:hypothetical protein